MADFEIRPVASGHWELVDTRQLPARKIDIFTTVDEAKKAANNLARQTVYYTPNKEPK